MLAWYPKLNHYNLVIAIDAWKAFEKMHDLPMLFFILVSENKVEENLYQGSLSGHSRTVEYVDRWSS